MILIKKSFFIVFFLLIFNFSGVSHANECGKITIHKGNWFSARLIANIDAIILKIGFDCDVEFVSGRTLDTLKSFSQTGQPSIMPEVWSDEVLNILSKGTADGNIKKTIQVYKDGARQGFYIPKYMFIKNPSFKQISGILKKSYLSI